MARSVTPAEPPDSTRPAVLRDAATQCTACELAGPATQTVFGEGPADAGALLVGEQPGDREDVDGRPVTGEAELRAVSPRLIVALAPPRPRRCAGRHSASRRNATGC